MSGDNLHDPQPEIRYVVNVHHHEEWEEMSVTEIPEILDVNEESMEVLAIKQVENEVADIVSEKQEPDVVYEKFDEPEIKKKIFK